MATKTKNPRKPVKKPASDNLVVEIDLIDPKDNLPCKYTIEIDLELLEQIEISTGQAIIGALLGDLDMSDLDGMSDGSIGGSQILKSLSISTMRRVLATCLDVDLDDVATACGDRGIGRVYMLLLPSLVSAATGIFAGTSDLEEVDDPSQEQGPDPTAASESQESEPS